MSLTTWRRKESKASVAKLTESVKNTTKLLSTYKPTVVKEKLFSFSTAVEKTQIQKAASLLNQQIVSLDDIYKRHEELRKMSDRHDPIERHFHVQQQQFLNVSNYYDRVRALEREIKQNEEKVDELKGSLNPFKLKENNMMKRRYLDKISDLESNKANYESSIKKY